MSAAQVRSHRRRHSTRTSVARAQGPAAVHHLRQRRRRQVDADRPAAVRVEADLRGPARGAGGRLEEGRHARRRARLRAAGRRTGGRARAGHHDRRRLPVLLDRPPQVHRRRHAGPRAVHAQHGDRRIDRGSRRDPDRRAQGRADADAAAQLHRLAARHPPRRAGHQQDGPGGLLAADVSTGSSPTTASSRSRSASTTSPPSRCRRCTATTSSSAARACPGTRARRCWSYLGVGRDRGRPAARSRSGCRCSG